MREAAPPRWGSRDALLVGSRLLTWVYAVAAGGFLVLAHDVTGAVMAPLSLLTAAAFWAIGRRVFTLSDETVDHSLLLLVGLPLVNALTHLAVAQHTYLSGVVALLLVGSGAVLNTRRRALSVVGVALAGWAIVMLIARPPLGGEALFYVGQLVVASLLGIAVLEIRLSVYRRLTRAIDRNELALRRFRSVFDDSPVGVGLADENGLFVEANAALGTLFGRPVSEIIGHSSAEFTHRDDLAAHARAGRMIEESADGIARVEKRYVRPGGEVRWAWLSFAHVAGPAGEDWTLAHMADVTSRHRAEEQLRLSRESMVAAVEIAQATQAGHDPRPVILGHLKRLAGASFVSLVEPLGNDRLVVTAVDGGPDLVGLSMSRTEPSVTTHVWSSGEAVFASELTSHDQVSPLLLHQSGAASLMWQPVGVAGDLLAVLSIAWDDPMEGVDTAGRAAVEAVAAEAGAALTGEAMRRELERSTVTDTLTGLLNRRGWETQVERIRQHTERTGVAFTLAVVDLDHFKRFNDSFGHLAGDTALRAFATNAQQALRVIDVVSRWGGEEFAVALHATSGPEARAVLERLRGQAPEGLTCSIGYVEVNAGDDLQQALSEADAALYVAKTSGRDQVVKGIVPGSADGPTTPPAQSAGPSYDSLSPGAHR